MNLPSRTLASISILLLILAASCNNGGTSAESTSTPVPTVVEPGLAHGIPCKPPCWLGLIPGESTCNEVEQATERLQAEGWADHVVGSCLGQIYSVSPSPTTREGTIHMMVDQETVTALTSSALLFEHTLGELIEQFGGPEALYLPHGGSSACSSCEDWVPPTEWTMAYPSNFLYSTQGLWFLALVPVNGLGCLCPEMRVTAFCYYMPRYQCKKALNKHPCHQVP